MSQEIISDIKSNIGIITIQTENGLNTITRKMLTEIANTAVAMDMNDEVKVLIIRGTEKAFSVGIDVNEFAKDINPNILENMYADCEKFADIKKPIIAAVSGYALGIGCELALACDIVFAAENACFGHPDLSLGTIPGFGATQRLTNIIGKPKTMEILLTGRAINAPEAERIGIVSRIIPLRYLFDEALKTANNIAILPDSAVNTSKELVKTAVSNTNLEEGLEIEKQVFKSSIASDEFRQNLLKIIVDLITSTSL